MDISISLDIKKQKLAREYAKEKPNKQIIKRILESIRRHERDMRKYNRWKRLQRKNKRTSSGDWRMATK